MSDEEGWRPTNLLEGVNRQFAWADHRVRTASIVGFVWGAFLVAVGAYQMTGALGVGQIEWNFAAGILAMLFSLGAASRNLLTTALLAALCVGEVPALTISLGQVFVEGTFLDQAVAALRIAALPAVLYNGIQGYAGAYEYQKLRRPSSERSWRAVNPAVLKSTIYSSFGLLVIGFFFGWSDMIMKGFMSPGAAVLEADGSINTSSRLSTHLQDNATNVQTFQQKTEEAKRKEEEERRAGREDAGEKKEEMAKEEQWKVQEQDERYAKDSAFRAGESASAPPGALPRHNVELKGPAYATAQEAIVFASKSDKVGCLTESLRRHDACKDEDCRHLAGIFVTACLPESKTTDGFCTGVPSMLSVIETTAWRARLCAGAGDSPQPCHVFYANLQTYCHPEDAEKMAASKGG